MERSNLGAVRRLLLVSAVLTLSPLAASAQIVERSQTWANLIQSHPCNAGLNGRHTILTDAQSSSSIGGGGGSTRVFVECDGVDTWSIVSIGGGASGPSDALASTVVIEGTTADAFEGNFTFADPTADWTWAWSAEGQLAGPAGTAAAPTYSFAGDSNTGIYSPVGDQIYFANGGVSTLRHIQYETQLLSLGTIEWGNSNDFSTISFDTVLKRHAAGVLRVGSSTTTIRSLIGGGSAVASATAMPAPTGRVLHVTGTTTITSITSTDFESGVCVTLIFDDALTFTDGNNLKLAGNFVTTADDTWSGCFDGANWYESSRSIN